MRTFKHKNGCEYRFHDDGKSIGIYKNGEFDKGCPRLDNDFLTGLSVAGFKEKQST